MKNVNLFVFILIIIVLNCCKKESEIDLNNHDAPNLWIDIVHSNDYLLEGDSLLIYAMAKDDNGEIARIEFYSQNELLGSKNEIPFVYTYNDLPSGRIRIHAKAYDKYKSSTNSGTIKIDVRSKTIPYVEIVNLSDEGTNPFNQGEEFSIIAETFDYDGNVERVLFFNGNYCFDEDTIKPFITKWHNNNIGVFNLYAIAVDNDNNEYISDTVQVEIEEYQCPSISIDLNPQYDYYYKGENIIINSDISYISYQRIEYFLDNKLISTYYDTKGYAILPDTVSPGMHNAYARIYSSDYLYNESQHKEFEIKDRLFFDSPLVDICILNDNSTIAALSNNKLYFIDSDNETIQDEIDLPYQNAAKFDYDVLNNSLYIVYQYYGKINIYDIDSESIEEIDVANQNAVSDIEIDEGNRKIFLICNDYLLMLNMDNGAIIESLFLNSGFNDIIADHETSSLYVHDNSYDAPLKKFDYNNNSLLLIESINEYDIYGGIHLSDDGNKLLFLAGGNLYEISTLDFSLIGNEYIDDIIYVQYPSNNNSIITCKEYLTDDGNNIEILSQEDYAYKNGYRVPFSFLHNEEFIEFSDGLVNNKTVVKTYIKNYSSEYSYLYFFEEFD